MNSSRNAIFATGLLLLCNACQVSPTPKNKAAQIYTLNPAQPASTKPARSAGALLLAPTTAPAWLFSTALYYRLSYADSQALHSYANSRWAAPPPELFSQQLGAYLRASKLFSSVLTPEDKGRATYILNLGIEEFGQIFDSADHSQGLVRLRATLLDGQTRQVLAQRLFQKESAALYPDAHGGILALDTACQALDEEIAQWLSQETAENASK